MDEKHLPVWLNSMQKPLSLQKGGQVTNTQKHSMLDYALGYAKAGFWVFPLHSMRDGACSCGHETCEGQGKHPRTKNGVKDATIEPEIIRQWWQKWPDANIGIATGVAIDAATGLYVIDIDTAKGATVEPSEHCPNDFRALLEGSLSVRTGSGGYHIYLRYDPELLLKNTQDNLGTCIDTRGQGGYVVAPPSCNAQGRYTWLNRCPMQPLPEDLLSILKLATSFRDFHKTKQPATSSHQHKGEAEKEVQQQQKKSDEIKKILTVGCAPRKDVMHEARNNYLMRVAGSLRRKGLDLAEIRAGLLAMNEARYGNGKHSNGPLSVEELEATIFKSIAKLEASEAEQDDGPEIVNAKEVVNGQAIPVAWIVPDLLSVGLILLAGKPKMGKSWLTLGLALTCALGTDAGERVLGRYAAPPIGVLYMGLEDGMARLQSRLKKLLNGRAVPDHLDLTLSWKPLQAQGVDDLELYLLANPDVKLVVIDTLACVRMVGKSSGNMYQEDYALMRLLKRLVATHDVAIMLVHHTRKMASEDVFDEISGSTGLAAAADTSLLLKRARGQQDATLHITARDLIGGEQDLALTLNAETCAWTCSGSVEERQTSQARQQILDLLREKGAMTPAEIAKELGKPGASIRKIVSRMLGEKLVQKTPQGHYTIFNDQSEQAAD